MGCNHQAHDLLQWGCSLLMGHAAAVVAHMSTYSLPPPPHPTPNLLLSCLARFNAWFAD
jgi:hypothetical protein